MSTVTEGQHLANQIRELREKAPVGMALGDSKFPANYFKFDPKDEKLSILKEIGEEFGKNFTIPLEDWIGSYFENKKRMIEYMEFENWVQSSVDLTDPIMIQWINEIHPQYFRDREQYITQSLDLMKRVELLKLRGPQSQDDLMLLYLLLNDPDFEVPEILWPSEKPDGTPKEAAEQINKGLFQQRKIIGGAPKENVPKKLGQMPNLTARNTITWRKAANEAKPTVKGGLPFSLFGPIGTPGNVEIAQYDNNSRGWMKWFRQQANIL